VVPTLGQYIIEGGLGMNHIAAGVENLLGVMIIAGLVTYVPMDDGMLVIVFLVLAAMCFTLASYSSASGTHRNK
jgi:hypothetical protein